VEYLIAIGLTFLLSLAIIKFSTKKSIGGIGKIRYSQTVIHESTKHLMEKTTYERPTIVSQAMKHVENHMIKVIVIDGMAYWVKDNIFYTSETNNGNIVQETAKPVDIENMSKEDLDKMLIILDNLGKRKNRDDSSSTGN